MLVTAGAGSPSGSVVEATLLEGWEVAADPGARADVEPEPDWAGGLKRSVLDPARFREVLGEPLGLGEGLRRTAEWAGSHR